MSTPTATLRSVKNVRTGIDISVTGYKEEKAPLGGVSILYQISIVSSLDLFKSSLHQEKDVVHFTIFKAYRELVDFHNKLNKKYQSTCTLPFLPKASSVDELTSEKKVELLNVFMEEVAKNEELCISSILLQFIGLSALKSSIGVTKIDDPNTSTSPLSQNEVFPKMKNVEKNVLKAGETVFQSVTKVDLFNHFKVSDDNKEESDKTSKSETTKSLFDEFDDDNLFTSEPVKKQIVPQKVVNPKTENQKTEVSSGKKSTQVFSEAGDSDLIIKDRKKGDISLFEEQDFGDFITEEEETLFLVTKPDVEIKKNSLLVAKNKILSPEKEAISNENLDELLTLSPLPVTPAVDSALKGDAAEKDLVAPSRPVPLPRKKSLTKTETSQKPEVMPRKVFLNKNDNCPKPSIQPKPSSGAAKPKIPPKPKPPPKIPRESVTRDENLDAENANKQPEENGNNSVARLADELEEFDILKYIEQEEKSLDSNLALFD